MKPYATCSKRNLDFGLCLWNIRASMKHAVLFALLIFVCASAFGGSGACTEVGLSDLIDALGGEDAYFSLPTLNVVDVAKGKGDKCNIAVEPDDLQYPVMKGTDKQGRKFIVYRWKELNSSKIYAEAFLQRDTNSVECWDVCTTGNTGLFKGYDKNKFDVDAFARFVKKRPVVNRKTGVEGVLDDRQIKYGDVVYFSDLIKTLGEEVYKKIPVLDLGNRALGYSNFLSPNDLKYSVMRGIDAWGRKFIALKWKNMDTSAIAVEVIFERYDSPNSVLVTNCPINSGLFVGIGHGNFAYDNLRMLKHFLRGEEVINDINTKGMLVPNTLFPPDL